MMYLLTVLAAAMVGVIVGFVLAILIIRFILLPISNFFMGIDN